MEATTGNAEKILDREDYEKHFDPKWYLVDAFSGPVEDTCYPGILKSVWSLINKEFPERIDGTALDFGSGPTLYNSFIISKKIDNIVCADFTTNNRKEVLKWLNEDDDAFDWGPVIAYIGILDKESPSECESRTRKSIKDVIYCDALADDIISDFKFAPFDLIISSLCLQVTCLDTPSLESTIKKLTGIMKPGGALILFGISDESYYYGGKNVKFASMVHGTKEVETVINAAGLVSHQWEILHLSGKNFDQGGKGYLVSARKPKEYAN